MVVVTWLYINKSFGWCVVLVLIICNMLFLYFPNATFKTI